MPPRRSTRAASLKPEAQPAPKVLEKLPARPRSQPTKKRAASPERPPSPTAKRTRTAAQKPENDPPIPAPTKSRKPPSKGAVAKKAPPPTVKKASSKLQVIPEGPPAPVPQIRPYFNPLPTPPPHLRPGLQLFVWGAGNFGQFGMGPDILGELDKPKRNLWVEEQMQEGTFGEEGAGLESIFGGGLHSLFVDEKGTVSAIFAYHFLRNNLSFQVWTCGVNDDAALGRITHNVPDPNNPDSFLDVDELTSVPYPLQSLVDEKFRAVQVASGDSICAALSDQGDLRVWGSFRVRHFKVFLMNST